MAELEEGEEAPKKKKSPLLIILILLILLGGGGAAAWFLVPHELLPFGLGEMLGGGNGTEQGQQNQEASVVIPPPDNLVTLPTFIVNLSDPQGRRFIRLGLALEVASPADGRAIRQQEPRVRDTIIMLLSSKTYAEISTADSKAELKRQITNRVNQTMGGPKVIQALITDLSIRYQ